MTIKLTRRPITVAAFLVFALLSRNPKTRAQYAGASITPGSTLTIPVAQVIQPEVLRHLLQIGGVDRPLILQVGSHLLYAEAHIPGSEYAGQGSQPSGLQQLQNRVSSLSRKKPIVFYCGCCPWTRCPNLAPAFEKLHEMGFTNVKVLYLADNFGADWANKGYPVEEGR
ncbi:MAG: rhodanese-like domain-containing protein [Terracidiphilus sp.]